MRVSINGRPAGELDAKRERALAVRHVRDVTEGVVRTPDEAIQTLERRMSVAYGVAVGVAAIIMVIALAITASYEPGDLIVFVPLVVVLGAGLAVLMRYVWRRNVARARQRTTSPLAAPGTNVRVADDGLTIGAERFAWSAVTADEVGVVVSGDDSSSESVEWLKLSASGRVLVLDTLTITNGPAIVSQAWRLLHAPPLP